MYNEVDDLPVPVKLGMPLITSENRIVSKAIDVPLDGEDASLPPAQDPHGVIRQAFLTGTQHRYTPDNALSFCVTFAAARPNT